MNAKSEFCSLLMGAADVLEGQAQSLRSLAAICARVLPEAPQTPPPPLDLLAAYAVLHGLDSREAPHDLLTFAAAHNVSLGDLVPEIARQEHAVSDLYIIEDQGVIPE